eukprot:PhF_6_TR42795/c0_g3_i2/m.64755
MIPFGETRIWASRSLATHCSLFTNTATPTKEYGLFASIINENDDEEEEEEEYVYLNVHAPFCFVAVGLQGSGKSHSLNVLVENCVLAQNRPSTMKLKNAVTTLIFQYDTHNAVPEILSLYRPNPASPIQTSLSETNLTIFVSPANYRERLQFYRAQAPSVTVLPLLFSWEHLTAEQIRTLMRVQESDTQLYMVGMMTLLRKYQQQEQDVPFEQFATECLKDLQPGQSGPLQQRLDVMRQFLYFEEMFLEIPQMKMYAENKLPIVEAFKSGGMVLCDLTDPLLPSIEA